MLISLNVDFSQLLNHHVATELMILDMLMNNMMERITDPCSTVRMLAVRGLGNIAVGSPEKVQTFSLDFIKIKHFFIKKNCLFFAS